jgi:cytochrome c2
MTRLTAFGLAAAGILLLAVSNPAEARPMYLKVFAGKYDGLKAEATKQKCNVCHYGKSKKNRNDYGSALMKLTGKNQKAAQAVEDALVKTEAVKNDKGVTFGSLIKAGKLPGTAPAE